MPQATKSLMLCVGAVFASLGASLCCILPVAVALLGLGSATLGAKLEPMRPWLIGATILFLGFAFYGAYRSVECPPEKVCAPSFGRHRTRITLWIVSLVALALVSFPYYVTWLF